MPSEQGGASSRVVCRSLPVCWHLAVPIKHALCESCALGSYIWNVYTTYSLATGQLSMRTGVWLHAPLLKAFVTHSDLPGPLKTVSLCSAGYLGPHKFFTEACLPLPPKY